jgi:hypothetical protein
VTFSSFLDKEIFEKLLSNGNKCQNLGFKSECYVEWRKGKMIDDRLIFIKLSTKTKFGARNLNLGTVLRNLRFELSANMHQY